MRAHVCVCVRKREREGESGCVRVCEEERGREQERKKDSGDRELCFMDSYLQILLQ